MATFIFKKGAKKSFQKLDVNIQNTIIKKLKELKAHPNIFSVLKRMENVEPATHRLRIGNYRLVLEHKKDDIFSILDTGHRKDIYE